jgi:hypothetical protein
MPTKKPKRLDAATVKADRAELIALKKLTDYAPPNADLTIEAAIALELQLRDKEEIAFHSANTAVTDRNRRYAAEWALHNTMQRIKINIRGQYGPNSDAIESLGLKKLDDYQRPTRRTPRSSSS